MIRTQGLRFSYGNKEVLNNINLEIKKGSFVAVIGANGSGKSTLARHLNALLLPLGGKVYVDGIDTADESRTFDVRSRVGMVFQNPDNQLVASVVEDEAAFASENLGVPSGEICRRVKDALSKVGLSGYDKRLTSELSGGEKQRLAIAAVLTMESDCIVLDEATSMLDPSGREEILDAVRELTRGGMTVILITHYMEEAIKADRVIALNKGAVVLDGAPEAVFSEVETLKGIGLNVPQTAELVYELRKSGIDVPFTLDTDELINSIERLLGDAANDRG